MIRFVTIGSVLAFALACGSSDDGALGAGGGGAVAGAAGSGAAGGVASTGGAGGGAGAGAEGGAAGGGGGSAGAAGGPPTVVDPAGPPPLAVTTTDVTVAVPETGHQVPMRCFVPQGGGARPLILVAHGFQLPASQYFGTAGHVAGFGHVVCVPDYPAGFTPNHVESAKDLIGCIDWALAASLASGNPLSGRVDPAAIGLSGHSLGGKLSVLAAAMDSRVKAVLGLDPVDSAMFCDPNACPDASNELPLPIPTVFLGETLDQAAGAGGQACAPKADNFETFFAAAGAPSLQVTLNGANHMSFLDDPAGCGLVCRFCQPATLDHAKALEVTRAYAAAFFSRTLGENPGYDLYLFGQEAQERWVKTGVITLISK